jgi:hypothetical protein
VIYLFFLCNELVCQENNELTKDDMSQYKRKMDLYEAISMGRKEGCKIIIWKAGKWPTVDNVFDECHAPCTIK